MAGAAEQPLRVGSCKISRLSTPPQLFFESSNDRVLHIDVDKSSLFEQWYQQGLVSGRHRPCKDNLLIVRRVKRRELLVNESGKARPDRKSTRLNSSHVASADAEFSLKSKK